ncbi:MAG: sulfotransferase domain-containing protein [Pseudomonadota bacterium]
MHSLAKPSQPVKLHSKDRTLMWLQSAPLLESLKGQVSKALGRDTFRPTPDEYSFLASYPRSGNTWLRSVLFDYTMGRPPHNLAEIDCRIPDEHHPIRSSLLLKELGPEPKSRHIAKTHALFTVDRGYRRALYVIRDPRHVISSYFRYRKRLSVTDFGAFCENCVLGSQWPGSWHDHVLSWTQGASSRIEGFAVVRYEDLVSHNTSAITAFASALGLSDAQRLSNLMHWYDLEKMKHLEAAGNRENEPARSDSGNSFIGNGKAPEDQYGFIDTLIREKSPHWLPMMERFGYDA